MKTAIIALSCSLLTLVLVGCGGKTAEEEKMHVGQNRKAYWWVVMA